MKPDNSVSQVAKKAIRLYDDILRNYPQYQRADQVLFFLGSAYQEINEPDKAKTQFIRLTSEYSKSSYVPQAYVQIGEYLTATKPMRHFRLTLKRPNTKTSKYGFAVYKQSWCFIMLVNTTKQSKA